jgi:ABC-type Mn2+/Zn2+ transport system permease subunit
MLASLLLSEVAHIFPARLYSPFCAISGTYISYFLNGATGVCIVFTQALFFTLGMVFVPEQGMLARRRSAVRGSLIRQSRVP